MPYDRRPAMPQVTAVDDQFGTHTTMMLSLMHLARPRNQHVGALTVD
jgi:hypothetical protein